MADTPEIVELRKIRALLEGERREDDNPDGNGFEGVKEAIEQGNEEVAEEIQTSSRLNFDGIKNLGKIFENLSFSMPEFLREGLQKFLGLDFKEKFFRSLDVIRDLPNTLGNLLEKIPGVGAIGQGLGTFFDILKNAALLAAAVIGLQQFLDGWDKAGKWFGKNPDFWDRLSSGLANIAQSWLGLTDSQTKDLALKIRAGFQWIEDTMRYLATDFFAFAKDVWAQINPIGENIKKIFAGDFKGGFTGLYENLKNIGASLLENKGALIAIALLLGPQRILGYLSSMLGAAVSLVKSITNIAVKLVATAFKLGVGAAKALASLALGAAKLVLNTGKFGASLLASASKMRLDPSLPTSFLGKAGLAGLVLAIGNGLVSGIGDGIEEYKKTGDWSAAILEGIKGFGLGIIQALTLGFFSKEEIEKGIGNLFKKGFSLADEIGNIFTGLIDGVKSFVNMLVEKVNSVLPDALAIDLPFPSAQVSAPAGYTHADLLRAVVDNENLSQAEKQKAADEIFASQKAGTSVQSVVANTNNQVIANAFTTSTGGGVRFAAD